MFLPKKIYCISDIHTEIRANNYILSEEKLPSADILILAGDIGCMSNKENYIFFLKDLSVKYEHIIIVPGNHEYYDVSFKDVVPELKKMCSFSLNIHILEKESIVIDGIEFIGTTLWSLSSKDSFLKSSEYQKGVFTSHLEYIESFIDSYKFLKNKLEAPSQIPQIVITHHLPIEKFINPRFTLCGINDLYATNILEYLNLSNVSIWFCGHSHESSKIKYGETLIISNPLGYPGEKRLTELSLQTYFI